MRNSMEIEKPPNEQRHQLLLFVLGIILIVCGHLPCLCVFCIIMYK